MADRVIAPPPGPRIVSENDGLFLRNSGDQAKSLTENARDRCFFYRNSPKIAPLFPCWNQCGSGELPRKPNGTRWAFFSAAHLSVETILGFVPYWWAGWGKSDSKTLDISSISDSDLRSATVRSHQLAINPILRPTSDFHASAPSRTA